MTWLKKTRWIVTVAKVSKKRSSTNPNPNIIPDGNSNSSLFLMAEDGCSEIMNAITSEIRIRRGQGATRKTKVLPTKPKSQVEQPNGIWLMSLSRSHALKVAINKWLATFQTTRSSQKKKLRSLNPTCYLSLRLITIKKLRQTTS